MIHSLTAPPRPSVGDVVHVPDVFGDVVRIQEVIADVVCVRDDLADGGRVRDVLGRRFPLPQPAQGPDRWPL